jgi:ketosteroid isomerase-like protein
MRRQLRHPHHREMTLPTYKTSMTKLFRLTALLLLTVFPVFAQNSPNDETGRIIALEHAWNRAIEAKDTKALDQILAPTFVGVDTDGSLANKSAFLASIKDPSYQPSQAFYEDIRAEIYGDTAITVGVFRIRESQKGKRVTLRQRFIDTWIKKSATWQCVASQVTLIPAK